MKKFIFKLLSRIIIVIALDKIGIEKINKIVVIIIDQIYNVKLFIKKLLLLIIKIDEIKLIELKIDEIPFKCKEKIIKFKVIKFWLIKGGYNVHPVLILLFSNIFINININEGIKSQNLKLFKRGKIKSDDININGNNQFLNLPIIIGIVIKNYNKSMNSNYYIINYIIIKIIIYIY